MIIKQPERALLSRLLEKWDSIPDDVQVPDALNDGIFDEVRELLSGASKHCACGTDRPGVHSPSECIVAGEPKT